MDLCSRAEVDHTTVDECAYFGDYEYEEDVGDEEEPVATVVGAGFAGELFWVGETVFE